MGGVDEVLGGRAVGVDIFVGVVSAVDHPLLDRVGLVVHVLGDLVGSGVDTRLDLVGSLRTTQSRQ